MFRFIFDEPKRAPAHTQATAREVTIRNIVTPDGQAGAPSVTVDYLEGRVDGSAELWEKSTVIELAAADLTTAEKKLVRDGIRALLSAAARKAGDQGGLE